MRLPRVSGSDDTARMRKCSHGGVIASRLRASLKKANTSAAGRGSQSSVVNVWTRIPWLLHRLRIFGAPAGRGSVYELEFLWIPQTQQRRGRNMIEADDQVRTEDRACPLGFLVVAAFASGLIWVCALLSHATLP